MSVKPAARQYPIACHACRRGSVAPVSEDRTLNVRYDGALHSIRVPELPVRRCADCGAATFGIDTEDAIHRALRCHLNLLQPEEIRANRKALNLTQEQLAEAIGCAAESLSRWENGAIIQSRSYDRLMRAYFHLPALRAFFEQLRARTAMR